MKRISGIALLLVLAACADSGVGTCYTTAGPDQLAERPSPLDSASIMIGEGEVKVCYGSPSARDREVMGALVPYGATWRFGANEATSIRVTVPSEIGGVAVDPGAYSIFVVPGETSWDVTLNGVVERWGIPIDESVHAADVATFQVTPEALEESVEALTMRFETAADGTHLVAEWEMTRIRIPIRVLQG